MLAVVLFALAAQPVEKPTTLALPGLRAFNIDPKNQSFFSEHLAVQLKLQGLQVVTQRELQELLGAERQKALLGCNDNESACMTELANALGTDGMVIGDMARIGTTFQVNLKVIDAGGKTLAAFSEAVSSEEAVLEVLTRAARELAEPTFRNLGRAPPSTVSVTAGPPNLRRVAWAPLALGAVGVGCGVAALLVSNATYGSLAAGRPATVRDGESAVAAGRLQESLAVVAFAVGGAALATGAVFLLFGPKAAAGAPQVGLGLSADGAAFTLAGVWP